MNRTKFLSLALFNQWRVLLALMTLGLTPLPAFADAIPPISVEIYVNQRQITVGDIVTYSIVIHHEPSIHILPLDPGIHFEKGLEYVDRGTTESKESDGQKEKTLWFKFRADAVGFYKLPKITVQFTAPAPNDPSRQIPGILQSPKAVIEVRSVLYQDGQPNDIKDIKPIIGAGPDWQKYLKWILLGLAILAGLGALLWKTRQAKATAAAAPSRVPDIKPHETALAELDRLMSRKLIEVGQFREHYFELSEIFRRYLGSLLSIPALDWTTEEIGAYVSRTNKIDADTQQTILSLLPVTDQIKFAKAPVELQTAFSHIEDVRDLIRATTPEMTSKFQVKSPMAV